MVDTAKITMHFEIVVRVKNHFPDFTFNARMQATKLQLENGALCPENLLC